MVRFVLNKFFLILCLLMFFHLLPNITFSSSTLYANPIEKDPVGETQEEKFKRLDGIIDRGEAYGGKKMLIDKNGKIINNKFEGMPLEQNKQRKLNDIIGILLLLILSFFTYHKRYFLKNQFINAQNTFRQFFTATYHSKSHSYRHENRLSTRISKRTTKLRR